MKTKGKKQCDLGNACPYQHEHQHTSEFAHDQSPEKKLKSFVGKGRTCSSARTASRGPAAARAPSTTFTTGTSHGRSSTAATGQRKRSAGAGTGEVGGSPAKKPRKTAVSARKEAAAAALRWAEQSTAVPPAPHPYPHHPAKQNSQAFIDLSDD